MDLAPLYLYKNEERRLRGGHLWVYSNEVDNALSPLAGFSPGQQVNILTHNGKILGNGYVNPHSLICARLISRDSRYQLDRSLLVHRLQIALALRQRLFDVPYYRLVHGEGDNLPGLIVDRYDDILVAQLNTAGMEAVKTAVVEALERVLRPSVIFLRNDSPLRALEGLPPSTEEALGTVPEVVGLVENGARFSAPILSGQKTGWYFDHRQNRQRVQRYVNGHRVLDLFSYLGAWGLQAAIAGASEVVLVESSAKAQAMALENATNNGVAGRVRQIVGDVFVVLKTLREEQQRFDIVIADPPAFIKRRRDFAAGLEAYHRLNRMAMQVLAKDGLLVSASCSFHLPWDELRALLLRSARHLDRNLQILEQGHQAADHPVHPAIPETDYVKCLFGRVLPAA